MKLTIRKRMIKEIPTLEVVPSDYSSKQLPLVIFYHGWQTSKELLLTQARKIAKKGFRVILPDAMFHGERKKWARSSIPSFTFWTSIQYNIMEFNLMIDYFKHHDWLGDYPIIVGGYSMGGITTAALMRQHPEIAIGVSIMGTPTPVSYFNHMQTRIKAERSIDVAPDLIRLLNWIPNYDLGLSPETINSRPLFIWHGTEDSKIPYSEAKNFYHEIKGNDYAKEVVFVTGDNEGHLVTPDLMEVIAQFIEKHTKRALN
ncbi:alpha/beta fold hydrolase [Vagococcus xieshaowenii]|uniref:Alpha/beta fold hydrolase n=1 Tax=Vagococcus xieshaowenii TaxID=2562451 RepID=A0AAJ5JL99_9ENTE|nr:alpha/beta fold hydrolase [Vagococcus xieshaowenii]QCA28346.1 alpha/beta fold hydrolase [Vagococcus xieshaowenii]TFZ42266.1 alpha/beta fold hydrolase [Vagococcus xieshaowenii]